jgi:saccharopine dehydrogenase-like NADP-dependent oxidoreductase
MGKALIIGCGGVASAAIHKCVQNSEVFEEICIASRTKSKCDSLKAKLDGGKTIITTAQVDANHVDELIELILEEKPDIVMNLALPYQDLTIMDACLATKTNYLDTANYEPEDIAKFEYKWQWEYRERFEEAGITALLGSGFDPGVTGREMYLLYHEELESLAVNIPGIKRIRFFMTFGQSYLTHLKCLENVGMTSIEPIEFEGKKIIPLQFLKAVLPDPASLGPRTKGKTNIGCIFKGKKDGKHKIYYVFNVCDHEECYREVGSQAVSYTTGVPAMIGAMMLMTGKWNKPGVYNIEEFDPDPFMDALNKWGLPWKESLQPELVDHEPIKASEPEIAG